jgi:hypothetical protein
MKNGMATASGATRVIKHFVRFPGKTGKGTRATLQPSWKALAQTRKVDPMGGQSRTLYGIKRN